MPWSSDDLSAIGGADELLISSRRPDGTLRPYVTIWVVRVGDELYVRSANGPANPWYRRATTAGDGRIRAGGLERDVAFAPADPSASTDVDRAYHTKYDRYGQAYVGPVVGAKAAAVTIRLLAKD